MPAERSGPSNPRLDDLLARHDLWRGRDRRATWPTLPTGHAALDRALNGGWPMGALVELLCDHQGIGEVSLLLPALAQVSRQGRQIAWIAPPHVPYAPTLAAAGIAAQHLLLVNTTTDDDTLWATEQALRSGSCGTVLAWPERADATALRRLQLAAEHGDAIAFLYRRQADARHPSPAALRLTLAPADAGITVTLIKQRGGWRDGNSLLLPIP